MTRTLASTRCAKRAGSAPVRTVTGRASPNRQPCLRAGIAPVWAFAAARTSLIRPDLRSVAESRDDPRRSTDPLPQPGTGVRRRSRSVSGGDSTLRAENLFAGGAISACRGCARRATPPGPPSAPARGAAGTRARGCETGALPARQQRVPARLDSPEMAGRRLTWGGPWPFHDLAESCGSRAVMSHNPAKKGRGNFQHQSQPERGCIRSPKQLIAMTTPSTSVTTSGVHHD